MLQEQVLKAIYRAIDEVNLLLAEDAQIHKEETTVLLGDGAVVDSLGLINLIVAVEQCVEIDSGQAVMLTQDDALTQPNGPLQTVGSLANHVALLFNG